MNNLNFKRMSFLFVTITTVFFFISCSNENDRNFFGLKGNVKSYLERIYEAEQKFSEWENGDIERYGHNRTKFDKNGNYTEIEYLDNAGTLTTKILPKREKGRIVEEATYNESGELNSVIKINYISDNKFKIESYDEHNKKNGDGVLYRENGKNIKSVFSKIEGDIKTEHTTTWEYDKKGNLIVLKGTNERGEIVFYQRHEHIEFDNQGNWIKSLIYEEDEKNPKNIAIREIEYY